MVFVRWGQLFTQKYHGRLISPPTIDTISLRESVFTVKSPHIKLGFTYEHLSLKFIVTLRPAWVGDKKKRFRKVKKKRSESQLTSWCSRLVFLLSSPSCEEERLRPHALVCEPPDEPATQRKSQEMTPLYFPYGLIYSPYLSPSCLLFDLILVFYSSLLFLLHGSWFLPHSSVVNNTKK